MVIRQSSHLTKMPFSAKILNGPDSFKKILVVEKSMKPRRDEKRYVMTGGKEFLLDKDSLEA